jgi:hypothetical protein
VVDVVVLFGQNNPFLWSQAAKAGGVFASAHLWN